MNLACSEAVVERGFALLHDILGPHSGNSGDERVTQRLMMKSASATTRDMFPTRQPCLDEDDVESLLTALFKAAKAQKTSKAESLKVGSEVAVEFIDGKGVKYTSTCKLIRLVKDENEIREAHQTGPFWLVKWRGSDDPRTGKATWTEMEPWDFNKDYDFKLHHSW